MLYVYVRMISRPVGIFRFFYCQSPLLLFQNKSFFVFSYFFPLFPAVNLLVFFYVPNGKKISNIGVAGYTERMRFECSVWTVLL